ncbi:MAG: cell division protein ZapA [Leptospiraceae bacterium]|nr:cell division protein ZapA [Leptospiraceae bacterium]MDW8306817.1 cell division protein ZapA [Leptospiraceae bacterium]
MAETQLTTTRVEILGRPYTLKGDVDPQYMVQLADYVNGRLRELRQIAPQADFQRLVLLLCLNLADEIFELRKRLNQIPEGLTPETLRAMYEKTQNLIEKLEAGLIGEPLRELK